MLSPSGSLPPTGPCTADFPGTVPSPETKETSTFPVSVWNLIAPIVGTPVEATTRYSCRP